MRSGGVDTALRTLCRTAAAAVLAAVVVLPATGARAADPTPSPSPSAPPRSIAVSVPPDPVTLTPGKEGTVPLRVVNPGTTSVRVRVIGRGLTLGDEGKVTLNDGPDPFWGSRADFPTQPLTVPAKSYKDLSVKVFPPASLAPDLYFLGFVVTPIPGQNTGITVINQIGGFFTINIPGPRDRHLTANVEFPGWSILGFHVYVGRQVDGTLHVQNVGKSNVQFWGETDTTTTGGSPRQLRIPESLVPIGRERTFTTVTKPAWPIGFVHERVQVIYPTTTEQKTTQIVFTSSILVINPLVLLALAVLILFIVWRRVRARWRRNKAARAKRGRAKKAADRRTMDRPSAPVPPPAIPDAPDKVGTAKLVGAAVASEPPPPIPSGKLPGPPS